VVCILCNLQAVPSLSLYHHNAIMVLSVVMSIIYHGVVSHLRLPHYRAYKQARPLQCLPPDLHRFSSFPLPVEIPVETFPLYNIFEHVWPPISENCPSRRTSDVSDNCTVPPFPSCTFPVIPPSPPRPHLPCCPLITTPSCSMHTVSLRHLPLPHAHHVPFPLMLTHQHCLLYIVTPTLPMASFSSLCPAHSCLQPRPPLSSVLLLSSSTLLLSPECPLHRAV